MLLFATCKSCIRVGCKRKLCHGYLTERHLHRLHLVAVRVQKAILHPRSWTDEVERQIHMVSRTAIAGRLYFGVVRRPFLPNSCTNCVKHSPVGLVHIGLCMPASMLFCGNPLQLAWVFAPAARPKLLCPPQEDILQLYEQMAKFSPWLEDCQDYFKVQGVHIYVLQPPSNIWHWCRPIYETADSVTVAWPGDGLQPTLQLLASLP